MFGSYKLVLILLNCACFYVQIYTTHLHRRDMTVLTTHRRPQGLYRWSSDGPSDDWPAAWLSGWLSCSLETGELEEDEGSTEESGRERGDS